MRRATRRQEEFPIGATTAYAGWRGFAAREVKTNARAGDFDELDGGRLFVERGEPGRLEMRVIDPGRALQEPRLTRRWTVKDLAQLNFSARYLSCADRLRFLRLYLGRPFRRSDRFLVRVIAMKTRRIAAHTAKHSLWVPGDPEAASTRAD